MSQAGRPRPRHIAFRIHVDGPASLSRRDMDRALSEVARAAGLPEGTVRLTRFDPPHGIASTEHRHDRALRAALPGITRIGGRAASLETLATSGTIKTLTDRLGVLGERGAKGGRKAPAGPAGRGAREGAGRTRRSPGRGAPLQAAARGPVRAPGRPTDREGAQSD